MSETNLQHKILAIVEEEGASRASCAVDAVDGRQLKGFDLAAVLEHIEVDFDLPARPVPVDQFDDFFQRLRRPIRQQAPFNRLDALWRADLARYDAGGLDRIGLAKT